MTTKTICITGAGNGIGRGCAVHFLGLGWRVAALDKDADALAELSAAYPQAQLLTHACDVGRESTTRKAFTAVDGWLDGEALGVLVNNAGIADPYAGELEDLSLESWQGWIDASLTAAFLCSREALPLLRRGEGASIANISSTRALMSEENTFAYSAAKGGVSALTHALAVSLGPEVRANAILPGWIETGPWQKESERSEAAHSKTAKSQHPAGRVGTVADIAEAVEWLAGAGFVTGQQIVIDGGMTVKMIYDA